MRLQDILQNEETGRRTPPARAGSNITWDTAWWDLFLRSLLDLSEGCIMKKGYIYIILAAIIFSTMEISSKMIAHAVNPLQLSFIRFLIGGLILLPLAVKDMKSKNLKLNLDDMRYFLVTGVLCVVVSMSFFQLAVLYTKASTVAIVFSANPIFIIPLAALYLKENITKRTVISLALSIIGILVIMNPFHIGLDIKGIILAILAAFTFAIYSVVSKTRSGYYGSMILNSITFLVGDLVMLILILITNIKGVSDFFVSHNMDTFASIPIIQGINSGNILVILYLGIVVTGLGYVFYFLAMDETSASTASVVFLIKPALAPVFALIILAESIPLNTFIGMGCILLGSAYNFMGAIPKKKIRRI
jgi:drug/metabolite transporter (DMT)-like permease